MKNFRFQILIRILAIGTLALVLAWSIVSGLSAAVVLAGALLLIASAASLMSYTERTNRELTRFLESIRYADFSHKFSFGSMGKSFRGLSDEFTLVFENFKKLRNEREETLRYLETVVQHVGVGLIAFDGTGTVELFNQAAKRIFGMPGIRNVEALDTLSPGFGDYLLHLPDNKKMIYRLTVKDETIQLLLYATSFGMRNQMFRLVAVQNILPELEGRELEAYQNLIRVLTHEIMNSIAPISSLASTAGDMIGTLRKDRGSGGTEGMMDDLSTAVTTIRKRSEGLVHFVDRYRSLTKIPKPSLQVFRISDLFRRMRILMETALEGKSITPRVGSDPVDLELVTDPELLEQVLLNLLNNAIQSLADRKNGSIGLHASIDELGRVCIRVSDNGPGIPEELLDKIFIPFFSTKKEGSGVGLSLSQQIIRSLGGSLSVSSKPGEETVFTIRL